MPQSVWRRVAPPSPKPPVVRQAHSRYAGVPGSSALRLGTSAGDHPGCKVVVDRPSCR